MVVPLPDESADRSHRPSRGRKRPVGRPARIATRPPRGPTAQRPLTVRHATDADLEVVAGMRAAMAAELQVGRDSIPDARALSRARTITKGQLGHAGQAFFLAIRGERCVGVLRCQVSTPPVTRDASAVAVFTSAFVLPQERRRGVLRSLLEAALHWCRTQGIATVSLRVDLRNTVGRRAWEALGFVPDRLIMTRDVPRTPRHGT